MVFSMTIRKKETKTASKKARVQFDFSKESLDKLDEIRSTIHAATRAEVIRRALTLFTEVLDAEQRGARIFFQEKDGTQARLILLV
jgi:hypothetical protein